MSVLLLERYLVDPARDNVWARAVDELLDAMRSSGGFLSADAATSRTEHELHTIASEWRSEADLDAFGAGAAYLAFRDAVEVCIREDPTVRRFAPRDGIGGGPP